MRILVTGAAASGKSAYAEDRVSELGGSLVYIATMLVRSPEDAARVHKHQGERADKGFKTFEITRAADLEHIARTLPQHACVLLEDLANLVSDTLFDENGAMRDPRAVHDEILAGLGALASRAEHLVLVGNELGSGLAPESVEIEAYLRLAGETACEYAAGCDEVHEVVCGIAQRIA